MSMSQRARCPRLLFVNKPTLETVAPRHLACAEVAPLDSVLKDTQPEMPNHATCQIPSDLHSAATAII